jgi:hypothetical protein
MAADRVACRGPVTSRVRGAGPARKPAAGESWAARVSCSRLSGRNPAWSGGSEAAMPEQPKDPARSHREGRPRDHEAEAQPLVGGAQPGRRAGVPHRVPEGCAGGGAGGVRPEPSTRMKIHGSRRGSPVGCYGACGTGGAENGGDGRDEYVTMHGGGQVQGQESEPARKDLLRPKTCQAPHHQQPIGRSRNFGSTSVNKQGGPRTKHIPHRCRRENTQVRSSFKMCGVAR